MKVLITSPKGKERLVQEFSRFAEVTNVLDSSVNLIIPTVDEELPFFASARDWFKEQGIAVMVASENTIYHCRDKAEFNLFCGRHGFQTPRTWQLEGILKPRFGKGSKGVVRIDKSMVLQEFMPFPEVSIDYFADLDGTFVSAVARYRLNIVNGESKDYKLVEGFDYKEVRRMGVELNLVGHNVIQGYWTGESFLFGEVNARYGGGSHLTFGQFSSPKWLTENLDVYKRSRNSLRSSLSRTIRHSK